MTAGMRLASFCGGRSGEAEAAGARRAGAGRPEESNDGGSRRRKAWRETR
jgi:hypothetical protein